MTSNPDTGPLDAAEASPQGHPRGLYTLFLTEMWERFSYYGMRALLVLFMVDAVRHGGLGMTDQVATCIYGLYTAAVYLAALPGGWVADRFLGAQRSVWYGGLVIAAGQFTLAIPRMETFYPGLLLVVAGTGLLKPNISAMVGELYPEGGARRDAGFTIFYMGINLGAALGPLAASTLGEKLNWHYGFGAAGLGMVLGLIQYRLSVRHLGPAGAPPSQGASRTERWLLFGGLGAILLVVGLLLAGAVRLNPVAVARRATYFLVAVAVLYFLFLLVLCDLTPKERERVGVIAILFVASAMFWSGFEQAGSTLNLFADRYTQRFLALANFEVPAGWFQSVNAGCIIVLAPLAAALWPALARRNLNPPLPVKFALGLVFLGGGFLVMAGAARLVAGGQKGWPTWLVTTYVLHSIGELCLSPIGLSSVTKLAPRRLVGQMMGAWFLATSLGNLIAGLLASQFRADAADQMPALYLQIVLSTFGTGLLLLVLAKPIKSLMAGAN
jgi:POT family proton-dependent oligopeptide transporter